MHSSRWRRHGAAAAACAVALALGACSDGQSPSSPGSTTPHPAQPPSPAQPATPSEAPSPTPSPSDEPAPTPSRTASFGGTLRLTLGEVSGEYADVVCETSTGLDVAAAAGSLEGVQFTVDASGEVTGLVITLPDGVTALVGENVGRATFTGDKRRFTVRGEAVTAADGKTKPLAFNIEGSCA
ncbi:lipoprotein LpqH [uncultured Tessaracoccus sp.]|uniref:lipoprotein LpqH n=1 Tax=uncultured Tessaracoccus sp. TaxID=905023 RepID=UPI00262C68C0|nr:lipoprotein LpqH [uncultured Tessaracoccus sp.]